MFKATHIVKGTNEEARLVRNKLIEFNSKHIPDGRYEDVCLCVKDNKGEVIAGLNGSICWNWMEIDFLWVDESFRGQGLGKKLLEEAERQAAAEQCTFIQLNTFSFQAPGFYEKNGFAAIAVIENAPRDHKHYYFIKYLR